MPLRTYTENFPRRRDLHPYERSLIELTFGEGYYEKVLFLCKLPLPVLSISARLMITEQMSKLAVLLTLSIVFVVKVLHITS